MPAAIGSPRAKLPVMLASQAQKNVTFNEAINQLDALICCSVATRADSAPPGSPSDGDAYVIAAGPTGAWTGKAGSIAVSTDGVWVFYTPYIGLTVYSQDETALLIYTISGWVNYVDLITAGLEAGHDVDTSSSPITLIPGYNGVKNNTGGILRCNLPSAPSDGTFVVLKDAFANLNGSTIVMRMYPATGTIEGDAYLELGIAKGWIKVRYSNNATRTGWFQTA